MLSFIDFQSEQVLIRFSKDHLLIAYLNIFQFALEEKAHILFFSELGKDGGNRDQIVRLLFLVRLIPLLTSGIFP